jgi:thiol:disulfide interchange protein DsbA
MEIRTMRIWMILGALLAWSVTSIAAAQAWVEGRDYFPIVPAQHTNVPPGKIEVTEVFSYACPYCAAFNPFVQQLRRSLPPNAQLVFVPASFNAAEDWPMFQRAACTAQSLRIFDKAHDAMFDAVWKTGELAISDPQSHRVKSPLPTIEDAARFYNRTTGIAIDKFVAASQSFSVDVKMRADDGLVVAYHVDGTPTLIVQGKYRISVPAGPAGMQKMIDIAKWLVARESGSH